MPLWSFSRNLKLRRLAVESKLRELSGVKLTWSNSVWLRLYMLSCRPTPSIFTLDARPTRRNGLSTALESTKGRLNHVKIYNNADPPSDHITHLSSAVSRENHILQSPFVQNWHETTEAAPVNVSTRTITPSLVVPRSLHVTTLAAHMILVLTRLVLPLSTFSALRMWFTSWFLD